MPILRGAILNPQSEDQCDFYPDGGLRIEQGKIHSIGTFKDVAKDAREAVVEVVDGIIGPAFVDLHVHAPQNHVKGQFSGQLLDWLKTSIWPEEAKFSDPAFAEAKARQFYLDMARQGTLLSLVFSTIHAHALTALFRNEVGDTIAGNVLMDQNSPPDLQQKTGEAIDVTRKMAKKHSLNYAVTPRFAPTCSMELMRAVAQIAQEYKTWIQSHLSENEEEVEWVKRLFPECSSYTEVYHKAGLLGKKTVMAHAIHLSDQELRILKQTGTSIAHCPTSNTALESGTMPIERIKKAGIPFALGSDVGAGPSLSMLHIMQAYFTVHRGKTTTLDALYRATLAGAEILDRAHKTGNLNPGKKANVVIMKKIKRPKNAPEAILDLISGSQQELESKVQAVYLRGEPIPSKA